MNIVRYGFAPTVLTPNEANRIHGNDEHISLQNVCDAVQVVLEILQGFVYG